MFQFLCRSFFGKGAPLNIRFLLKVLLLDKKMKNTGRYRSRSQTVVLSSSYHCSWYMKEKHTEMLDGFVFLKNFPFGLTPSISMILTCHSNCLMKFWHPSLKLQRKKLNIYLYLLAYQKIRWTSFTLYTWSLKSSGKSFIRNVQLRNSKDI